MTTEETSPPSPIQISGFQFRPIMTGGDHDDDDLRLELTAYRRPFHCEQKDPPATLHITIVPPALRRAMSMSMTSSTTIIPVIGVDDNLKCTCLGRFRVNDDGGSSIRLTRVEEDCTPPPIVDVMRDEWNLPLVHGPTLSPVIGHRWSAFLNPSALDVALRSWMGALVIDVVLLLGYDNDRTPDPLIMLSVREACIRTGVPHVVLYGRLAPGRFSAGLSCVLLRPTDGATQRVHFGRDTTGSVQLQMGEIALHFQDVL